MNENLVTIIALIAGGVIGVIAYSALTGGYATISEYGDIGVDAPPPAKEKRLVFDASNSEYEKLKVAYDELLEYATLLRGAIEGVRWSDDPYKALRETYHVVFDTTPMDRVGKWRHRQLKNMNRHNQVDMVEVEQAMAEEMYERRTQE